MDLKIISIVSIALLGSIAALAGNLQGSPSEVGNQVAPYFDSAIGFVEASQQRALDEGTPLAGYQIELAARVGVEDIEKVRVAYVDELPRPENEQLAAFAQTYGLDSPSLWATTYGHGIFIRSQFAGDKKLLAHELIHVTQYEQLGIPAFVKRYLVELVTYGYRDAPLEVEAYSNAPRYE